MPHLASDGMVVALLFKYHRQLSFTPLAISPVLFLDVSSSDLNCSSCAYYPFYGKQIVIIKGAPAAENYRRKGTPDVSGSIIRIFTQEMIRFRPRQRYDDEVQEASEG